MSHMVRVDDETHDRLLRLAEQEQDSIGDLVSKAIQAYQERLYWDQARSAAEALRSDPDAWKEELEERALWDATLADGSDDPPYPMDKNATETAPPKRRTK